MNDVPLEEKGKNGVGKCGEISPPKKSHHVFLIAPSQMPGFPYCPRVPPPPRGLHYPEQDFSIERKLKMLPTSRNSKWEADVIMAHFCCGSKDATVPCKPGLRL